MRFRAAVLDRVNTPLSIDTLEMAPLQPGDVLVGSTRRAFATPTWR